MKSEKGFLGGYKAKFSSWIHHISWLLHVYFGGAQHLSKSAISPDSIPVLINNFNRLEPLAQLTEWLCSLDEHLTIIILDNKSTYQPLLKWYASDLDSRIQVIKLNFNSGLLGISYIANQLPFKRPFIVTDPDLVPSKAMPQNVISLLIQALDKHPELNHVGLSLEIEDLPVSYPIREAVKQWEDQFWRKPIDEFPTERGTVILYDAPIDTTFAMYRPDSDVNEVYKAGRLGRPYTLCHVDWYVDPNQFTAEYQYYLSTAKSMASWTKTLQEVVKT